ncbi:MAG: Mur ligase family protein [Acidimicrobiales bacterium]
MLGTLTGPRTTPEAPELQAIFAEEVARGGDVVAMEVSSHALALHRVAGTRFAVGVFTNLGQDHLDFHGDLATYEAAKTELFSSRYIETAVINVDDPAGRRIADQCDVPVRPYGLADVEHLRIDGPVSTFTWRGHEIVFRLPGSHNVLNALAAALACIELGIETVDIADALCHADGARGRFEMVSVGQPFSVVVDSPTSPKALQAVITACRQIVGERADSTPGRVIVVIGCGGDRDPFKRPLMGEIGSVCRPRSADIGQSTIGGSRGDPRCDRGRGAGGATFVGVEDRGPGDRDRSAHSTWPKQAMWC